MSVGTTEEAEHAQQPEAESHWVCSFPANPFLDLVLEHKSHTATIKAWSHETEDECVAFVTFEADNITDGEVQHIADLESGDDAYEYANEYADNIEEDVEDALW